MKVLSIITLDTATLREPTPEEIGRMEKLINEMRTQGALIDTAGTPAGSIELKVERRNGKVSITDGPFTESKEHVGGYALLEVSGRDEAIEQSRRILECVTGNVTFHLHEVVTA